MAFINQPNDNKQSDSNAQSTATATPTIASGAESSGGGSAASPASAPGANKPKGSGRFTNIQKYISANEGAGNRLASGVGTTIQNKLDPTVKKSEQNLENVRQGIQAGRNTLNQGQQMQQQVADANFDATTFAANQDNVNNFTNFRTGQAFDEAALKNTAQTAQQQILDSQKLAQQTGQQFGTEQGRQQLLKQTFSPGRNYSTGQQRLDGLFLSQAAPQIQQIQSNLRETDKKLSGINTNLATEANNVNSLATEEQDLVKGLTDAITGQEKNLVNQVLSTRDSVNQARMADQEAARKKFAQLVETGQVDKDFATNLGIADKRSLYNVLKEQGNMEDYIKFNDTLLTSADQLANQQQRAKYDAIARLAGIEDGNRNIRNDTVIDAAVNFNQNLGNRISDAEAKFNEYIKGANVSGTGLDRSSTYKEALRDRYIDQLDGSWESGTTIGDMNNANLAAEYASGQSAKGNLEQIVNAANSLSNNQIAQNNADFLNQLNSNIAASGATPGGVFGTYAGRGREQAVNQARQQALQLLAEQGYFNRLNVTDPTQEDGGSFNVS